MTKKYEGAQTRKHLFTNPRTRLTRLLLALVLTASLGWPPFSILRHGINPARAASSQQQSGDPRRAQKEPLRDNTRQYLGQTSKGHSLDNNMAVVDSLATATLQLSAAIYSQPENAGSIGITVNRTGDLSVATTVDFATSDGTALERTDYTITSGTLSFDAGESSKTFLILIVDDSYQEGDETLNVVLSNPTGAGLASPSVATVIITDNDTVPAAANAVEDAGFFVRQHYYDFLSRVPDAEGMNYWSNQISTCGSDTSCVQARRIGVSAAFFVELEFQKTGFVVYRLHRAAYGTFSSEPGRANLLYRQFMPDRATLVGGPQLEQSTVDFANRFVLRPEFKSAYPDAMTPTDFVNKLFDTASLTPFTAERAQEISALSGGSRTRAQILLDVINLQAFIDREYNPAFVLMQYFGYLRRDPDQGGYDFWLNVLANREPNNFRGMVCSFITSSEYQERFSPVTNRTNSDCQAGTPSGNMPPLVTAGAEQTIALPLTTVTLSGLVTDDGLPTGAVIGVMWTKLSGPGNVVFSNPTLTTTMASFSAAGTYVLRLFVTDSQLTNSAVVRVNVLSSNSPPDPVDVAPPVDPTVSTAIGTATTFLYTGPNPIQTGVTPGTINHLRVAVLRGHVITRDGSALSGARITVANHPEFGQTKTRADGMFDMAVNGGGSLTVNYEKDGFLTAQRAIVVPWRDYVWLPDVVVIPFDTTVTAVDLSAPAMQMARGSAVSDADGTRRATILFPSGTAAAMTLPNGTSQPLTNLSVRATEYTIGAAGPQAMPGPLPPSSGYTYAAELSLDQAVAAGATDVSFSQALPLYVENFLGFPVGTAVPTGYYDRQKAQWIASANGRVIKVLSINNNMADLDIDGSGAAAGSTALGALGVTTEERANLALLYTPGQTLWRAPITHFTPWDCNWPYGAPPDSFGPPGRPGGGGGPGGDGAPGGGNGPGGKPSVPGGKPSLACGSVIGCEDQTLGESVPVSGTPWQLHYKSDRTPGRKDANTLQIQVSGATPLPASLTAMRVEVSIAGRLYKQTFAPALNLNYTVTWDGKDGYGRLLQGVQPALVQLHYDYVPQYYGVAADQTNSFARAEAAGSTITGSRNENRVTLSKSWTEQVGLRSAQSLGMGGWSLSIQHSYDVFWRTLLLGNGRERRATAIDATITTAAGLGAFEFAGDGGLARQAQLNQPSGVAVAPDGSLYIADRGNSRIRRVGPDGIITTVAGAGIGTFSGDGGPATLANLSSPVGVAVAPDGSLYIGDSGNNRVRRVGPNGIITTAAGTGLAIFGGDGGPATQAQLKGPSGVAVGPDGSLYIADIGNHRVRRVGLDGIITTVAGTGEGIIGGFSGDGGPAILAQLSFPQGVAVAADGTLFIADANNRRIRRVGPDGIITTVAGSGIGPGFAGDGSPATEARLGQPEGVAVGSDGSIYIADLLNQRIRRVRPDGVITTVAGSPVTDFAGNGIGDFAGDGGWATQARLNRPRAVALGPDGSLYIADSSNNRIRQVGPALPGFSADEILIAAEDGSELYVFNSAGRHLRTLDALTGILRLQFSYSTEGYLTSITDESGQVTTIERNGAAPAAIVAPGGQRTSLSLNGDGWLRGVSNPGGETHTMNYSAEGLLQSFAEPLGNVHHFTYDALGLLIKDEDPGGGSTSLAHTPQSNGYTVTTTSALGRHHSYQVEQLPTGAMRSTVTAASGAKTVTLINADGSRQVTYPDGTVADLVEGPDPRFGMQAPILKTLVVTTPGGITTNRSAARAVTLSDPFNVLSLTSQTDTVQSNGRTYTSLYNSASRTFTLTTPTGRQRQVMLDSKGRLLRSAVDGLTPVERIYNNQGRIISLTQGDRISTFAYNSQAFLSRLSDPLGHTADFDYDAVGRTTQITRPDGKQIQFAYDANGKMISLTPADRAAHTFNFTPVGLLQRYGPPTIPGSPTNQQFTYNFDRQPTQITHADTVVTLAYDSAGRLQRVTSPQETVQATYDAANRINTLATASGIGLTYTNDGSLLTRTSWSGPVTGTVQRTFDNNLRLNGRSINGANSQTFTYDADGLLSAAGALTFNHNSQNGLLTGSTLGLVSDTRSFNAFGEWTSYSATAGATSLFSAQYTQDQAGRITQLNETIAGFTANVTYKYDLVGRLIEIKRNGATSATYTYDANGNRLAHTTAGGETTANYDAQDRLTQYGATTFTYTANGDLSSATTGGQTTTYVYDVSGNLRRASLPGGTEIEYLIDGRNRRIGKKIDGTRVQGFLYESRLKPVAELDQNNTVISTFVYGSRPNVPDYIVKGDATYRIIADHLGSPRLVVDTVTGAIAQRLDYDEFGNVQLDTNPGFQPFGYAGGLYDRDTQFVRFGARDYDARVGRWTTKDVAGLAGGLNLYTYVGNDPVNFIDFTGKSAIAIAPLVAAGAGAAGAGTALGGLGAGFAAAGITIGTLGAILIIAAFESSALEHSDVKDDEGPNEGGAPKQDGEVDAGDCPNPMDHKQTGIEDNEERLKPHGGSEEEENAKKDSDSIPKERYREPRIPVPETPEDGFDQPPPLGRFTPSPKLW